jgi:hypothetical protein
MGNDMRHAIALLSTLVLTAAFHERASAQITVLDTFNFLDNRTTSVFGPAGYSPLDGFKAAITAGLSSSATALASN